jgi:arsenite methyltransferase
MSQKPDYGIDAPGVVFGFLAGGSLLVVAGLIVFKLVSAGPWHRLGISAAITGAVFAIEGLLMLIYSKYGKFRHRERMLAMHKWKGDEHVLDVGTGRGLLLVGAAKKLTSGRGVGIDIWSAKDLSGNAMEKSQQNLALEGVQEKAELRSESACEMSFPPASFDVVLSNLCLHNIPDDVGRILACREIARVLKPGGVALISDYKNTRHYARVLKERGLDVMRSGMKLWATFPPLRIVKAVKPASRT